MKGHSSENWKGIDVSHWNGNIDWQAVQEQGIDFVFIKATEGKTFKDPMFEKYYEGAKKAGLLVGVYHFARFTDSKSAVEEAEFFIDHTKGKAFDLPLALDLEENDSMSKQLCTNAAEAFLGRVEKKAGKKPLLYSNPAFITRYLKSSLGKYPLWIAHYNTKNPRSVEGWANWMIWQYRSDGKLKGINGHVDFNEMQNRLDSASHYKIQIGDTLSGIAQRFQCSLEELITLNQVENPDHILPGNIIEIPIKNQNKPDYYIVKSGETLSGIAEKTRVSIESLSKLNGIKNRNLIYEGQRLRLH